MKHFKREGSKIWLLAENPEFVSIEASPKEQELTTEGLSVDAVRR